MKTKFFKSGIGAMMALAVVALTTPMFTSCTNEDIAIGVTPATPVNAKAYITPIVVANGVDVTSSAVLSWSSNPISGGGSYYFEGNPTLGAMSVTVSATYQGMSGSTQITIPAVAEGSSFATVAKVFLSYAPENLVEVLDVEVENVVVDNPTIVGDPIENTTDYTITKTIKYVDIEGTKVIENDYTGIDEGVWAKINSYARPYSETEKEYSFEVPANSVVTPVVKTVKTVNKYMLNWETRAANTVATIVVEDYTTTVTTDSVNISHGDGHGHGHGNDTNAGGGSGSAD